MSSINDLLTLHQYKVSQNKSGMDSFADQLNATMESKYEEKKKMDRQEKLLKRLETTNGNMDKELELDSEGKITAKFKDKKAPNENRSYDKDIWKRAQDIAKAQYAGDNPFYNPTLDQIMQSLPAAKAMFDGNYPSLANPSASVTPDAQQTQPANAPKQGFNFGQMFGNLLQKIAPGQQTPQIAAKVGARMAPQPDQNMESIKIQAIQALEAAGLPVDENNLKAAMQQVIEYQQGA